ncbi:MAG: beta-N-acetylhexosaminidase [Candidatus Eutrophobiaceae bacterium]
MHAHSLMCDINGLELSQEEREILNHPLVGGVILFARNYADPKQLRSLAEEIHAIRSPALLVAVDQEGGRIQRFVEGLTRLPSCAAIGAMYGTDPEHARHVVGQAAWLMAAELCVLGVDFSFAPVVDLDYGVSKVIGDRAFSGDPQTTIELAGLYVQGMRMAGMSAVIKHFPGHGATPLDSHLDLPVDDRSLEEIEHSDLMPFAQLIQAHPAPMGVMAAHILFPQVDAAPAGYSSIWLDDILRGQLGFTGAVFSDDLNMAGAAWAGSDFAQRAEAAAGCDMILVCNNSAGLSQILDGIQSWTDSPVLERRLDAMRSGGECASLSLEELRIIPRWCQAAHVLERLESLE